MEADLPTVELVFYREEDGTVPVLEWLDGLEPRIMHKCRSRLLLLRRLGYRMRRPEVDYLGEGIYELRFARAGLRYRILYGFHGRELVLLLSAFVKTVRRVPTTEVRLARRRFDRFIEDPRNHSYSAEDL